MKFYVRNKENTDYYEKKHSKPYIPSSVEPKPLDQYWDIWATYLIEKVEYIKDRENNGEQLEDIVDDMSSNPYLFTEI